MFIQHLAVPVAKAPLTSTLGFLRKGGAAFVAALRASAIDIAVQRLFGVSRHALQAHVGVRIDVLARHLFMLAPVRKAVACRSRFGVSVLEGASCRWV